MRKLALTGVLALGCLFWTALTPQQIAVNSAVFGGYSDFQLETANTYLLASIAGIAINPANILSNAAGFGAYSDRQLQEAQTYLLSQITSSGGLPANAAGALTNDGVGNIGWLAGIGGSSGSGLPGTNQIIARGSTQNTNWVSETPAGLVETNSNGGSVTLSNGTIVANGPAGVNGNITLNDSAGGLELTSTNGGLWIKNGITDTGHTNTSLTASRVILTDANKGEVSAAASGAVPINADGSATTGAQGQALGYVLTNDSRALTLSGTNYWHGNNVWDGGQLIFSNNVAVDAGSLNVTNGVIQATNTSAASQGVTLDPTKNYSTFSGGEVGIGTTGITNAGYLANAGGAGLGGAVTVTNAIGYITNAPATGNATITWDASKDYSMVSTSVAVTVNITGLVAGQVFHSTLVLSNQSGTARAVTGGGFSMMTNSVNTPTSALNMTNNDSKHQRLVLKADGVAGVLTNVWAYQVYDP